VHHFASKLQAIGCAVAPRTGPGERFELSPYEVERLAELEHARWRAEREAGGWRYGATRNNRRKRHPDLVDWPALAETSKDLDRDAVRNLYDFAEALDDQGLQIIRLIPPASGTAHADQTLAARTVVTGS
jgi:RyR domain